jgi:hypothetical protein
MNPCKKGQVRISLPKEKIIKAYFSGWVQKDWRLVEENLDPGFTFTSPAGDDHLPTQKFKDKCWVQAAHILRFDFKRFAEAGTGAYVTYQLFTTDSADFNNTEYFDFNGGKIKSIEVFFRRGQRGKCFPTNKQ